MSLGSHGTMGQWDVPGLPNGKVGQPSNVMWDMVEDVWDGLCGGG